MSSGQDLSTVSAPPDAGQRRRTFLVLGLLHAGQYLPINFIHLALVAILREQGASLTQLATLNLAALLLAAKFLWAPILDKYGSSHGHYRSWLLVLQPTLAISVILLLPLDPVGDFGLLLAVIVVVVQAAAMQDVAADALAIRSLTAADRSTGSGFRLAGGYIGHILGGGAVLAAYGVWGWQPAIVLLAILTVLPVVPLARFSEPPMIAPQQPTLRTALAVFRRPGVARWALVILPVSWVGVTTGYALVTPMLVDAGWSGDRVALIVGIAGSTAGGFAALGTGWLVRRLGRKQTLSLSCFSQALVLLALSPLALGHAPFAPTIALSAARPALSPSRRGV